MSSSSQSSGKVMAANKSVMEVKASVTVMITPKLYDIQLPINDCLYVPDLSTNLLAVSCIVMNGYSVLFTPKGCILKLADGRVVATGTLINGLIKLEQKDHDKSLACGLNYKSLKQLSNGMATGVGFKDTHHGGCRVCPKGKQARLPFPKEGSRATEVLEVVHSDICGPMEASLAGSKWFVIFIDDKTRRIWIYFLKLKNENRVTEAFRDFKAFEENYNGKRIKTLRTDNGIYRRRLWQITT